MKKPLLYTLAGMALIALLGIATCSSYIGFRQSCVSFENDIAAQDREMQNVDTEVNNSLRTQGLSAQEYGKLCIDAIKAANAGRYGADGSKAMMQWIKEQNPTIDAGLFKRIMIAAEAGYSKFAATQRRKIDLAREYKNLVERKQQVPVIGYLWTSGFPRKPWGDFERVIVSGDTKKTWESGIKDAVDPFKR